MHFYAFDEMNNPSKNLYEDHRNKWWKCIPSETDNKSKQIITNCTRFIYRAEEKEYLGCGSFGHVYTSNVDKSPPTFVQKFYKVGVAVGNIEAEVRVLSLDGEGSQYFPKLLFSGYNYRSEWIILMQYVGGGTLWYHLVEEKSMISFEAKRTILWQIARGLEFLHKNKLTHGDLKTDNIALTYDGHARLFDFNNSRLIEQKEKGKRKRKIEKKEKLPQGSICFQAPEVFMGIKAGLASDLWSYGVVVAHLVTEELIIRHALPLIGPLLAKTIKTGNEAANKYVHHLMKIKPSNRLKKISTHVFFKDVSQIPLFKPGYVRNVPKEDHDDILSIGDIKGALLEKTSIRIPNIKYLKTLLEISIASFPCNLLKPYTLEIFKLRTQGQAEDGSSNKRKRIQIPTTASGGNVSH